MNAFVLAGGEGVRLRPLTYSIPKPLIPIGETPILEKIVRRLAACGFQEIILALGYRGELIETYFQDGSAFGVRIRYVREPKRLGTAGPLSLVRRAFAPEGPLLVMNGDILTRLDLGALLDWHRCAGYEMTVAVRTYESQLPFGAVRAEGDRLVGLIEKPKQQHLVSAGMYVVEPAVLSLVPDDAFFDMPDLVAALLQKGRPIGAFRFDDEWLAVDGLTQLEEAKRVIMEWSD